MKLLIRDKKIIATATDEYNGNEKIVVAPDDFDVAKLENYIFENDELILVEKTTPPSIEDLAQAIAELSVKVLGES
jgi:hypothetical protein